MKKKLLCGALLAAMLAATFTSCGDSSSSSTTNNTGDESAQGEAYVVNPDEDPYTVHFVHLLAQEGDHYDQIVDAINEICLEEMNMIVDPITVTYGTAATTLNMMLPAGEPLDIFMSFVDTNTSIDCGYILDWSDYAYNLTDVIDTYGEDNLKAAYVGDFWATIPSNFERVTYTCFLVRDDIMEELGHSVDDYDPYSFDILDLSTFEPLTELFQEVKDNYPGMVGISGTMAIGTQTKSWCDGIGTDNLGVLLNPESNTTISNYYESQEFYNICTLNKEWFDKGFYTADIATQQDSIETILKAGNTFSGICNSKPNTVVEKLSQCGYPVNCLNISDTLLTSQNWKTGYQLAAASEDPAKAAAWYNWAFTSTEFNDLINWGLEGTDWVLTDDGMATYPDGADVNSVGFHNDYGWIYPNQMVGHAWEGNDADIWDQYEEFNKGDRVSTAMGFVWSSANVTDQYLACQAVYDQYIKQLVYGTVSDIDASLKEFNDALYAAGLQDIIDDQQAQFDAWRS